MMHGIQLAVVAFGSLDPNLGATGLEATDLVVGRCSPHAEATGVADNVFGFARLTQIIRLLMSPMRGE
jgi:hypothetical protein